MVRIEHGYNCRPDLVATRAADAKASRTPACSLHAAVWVQWCEPNAIVPCHGNKKALFTLIKIQAIGSKAIAEQHLDTVATTIHVDVRANTVYTPRRVLETGHAPICKDYAAIAGNGQIPHGLVCED